MLRSAVGFTIRPYAGVNDILNYVETHKGSPHLG